MLAPVSGSFSTPFALGLITFTPAAGLTILEGALSPVVAGVMAPAFIPSSPELVGYFGLVGLVGDGYLGLLGPVGAGYLGLLCLEDTGYLGLLCTAGAGYSGLPGPWAWVYSGLESLLSGLSPLMKSLSSPGLPLPSTFTARRALTRETLVSICQLPARCSVTCNCPTFRRPGV